VTVDVRRGHWFTFWMPCWVSVGRLLPNDLAPLPTNHQISTNLGVGPEHVKDAITARQCTRVHHKFFFPITSHVWLDETSRKNGETRSARLVKVGRMFTTRHSTTSTPALLASTQNCIVTSQRAQSLHQMYVSTTIPPMVAAGSSPVDTKLMHFPGRTTQAGQLLVGSSS